MDQLELLEHGLDRLEVVVGVHVQHRVVLVVELAVGLGAGAVALDQVLEIVVVAGGMAVRVHGHKASVLQKARVDAATGAREVGRHAVNDVVLEPLKALVHRQVVDGGGRVARIDGAAHHGHAQRRGLATAGHQRHRGQHRHGGLAHAHHMAVAVQALQVADELLHIVDVVVQVELAVFQRHQARVLPVGDVDLVVLQHGAHGVAQQRGVVARQRRHDQHHRLVLQAGEGGRIVGKALEAAQLAKRFVDLDALVNRNVHALDLHRADAKFGLDVVLAQAVQQRVAGRHALGQRRLRHRVQRVAVELGCGLRQVGKRLHDGALGFVELVEHRVNFLVGLVSIIRPHTCAFLES